MKAQHMGEMTCIVANQEAESDPETWAGVTLLRIPSS